MNNKLYRVGLYIRLSVEDKHYGESTSVENQRAMLSGFIAHIPNWIETRTYVDDGASGGNFNRKGFQDMMEDVRNDVINLVIVKDLSRFGRNYLEAGRYLEEELPALGCRFVALSDGIDTVEGESEIIPFLNAINDFYIRDVSVRIKSVFLAKAKDGQKLTGVAPYGYVRKDGERSRLAIDEYAALVVKRIFELRANGYGYTFIAGVLNSEGILSPRAYYFHRQGRVVNAQENTTSACSKIWATRTVKLILNNELYIGNTVSFKRGTRSYRDKREYRRDESEWLKVEHTHIPIVESEIWDKVQAINKTAKARVAHAKKPQPKLFTGLLLCPECGTKMGYKSKSYQCRTFQRSGGVACSPHRISEEDLKAVVISHVKEAARQITLDEDAMIGAIRSKLISGYKTGKQNVTRERQALEQQLYAFESQIDQLYEDRVEGMISAETFTDLANDIEARRVATEEKLLHLNQATLEANTKIDEIDKNGEFQRNSRLANLVQEKSTNIEVDRELLDALIEKIEVGELSWLNEQAHHDVAISYKHIGPCDNLP
ncbi:MAG: recombinase family protein [Defluviitaleaceae bacterium]|nr:recombinase family protein [Defluviitaleaceae bacterium]